MHDLISCIEYRLGSCKLRSTDQVIVDVCQLATFKGSSKGVYVFSQIWWIGSSLSVLFKYSNMWFIEGLRED